MQVLPPATLKPPTPGATPVTFITTAGMSPTKLHPQGTKSANIKSSGHFYWTKLPEQPKELSMKQKESKKQFMAFKLINTQSQKKFRKKLTKN